MARSNGTDAQQQGAADEALPGGAEASPSFAGSPDERFALSSDLDSDTSTADVRGFLEEHVPLALLADLAAPDGPASDKIMDSEGLPADSWWAEADQPAVRSGE